MEGKLWEQFLLGWDEPVKYLDDEDHVIVESSLTLQQSIQLEERYRFIRRAVNLHMSGTSPPSITFANAHTTSSLCEKHLHVNLDNIVVPTDIGLLDHILGCRECSLCQFVRDICWALLSAELRLPGTYTRCSLVPVDFKDQWLSHARVFPDCPCEIEPLKRELYLTFDGEEYDYRQRWELPMIPLQKLSVGVLCAPPCSGRIIRAQVDMQLLKSWFWNCRTQHSKSCEEPNFQSGPRVGGDIRVLDVYRRMVISSATDCEYAALSYRWGGSETKPFMSTKSNSMNFLGEIIDLPIPSDVQLPATIEDAVGVTKALDLTYLWVDSICIVQDDSAHSTRQISLMGDIYSSAVITIFAAGDESCWDCLPGVRAGSRSVVQVKSNIGKSTWVNVLPRSQEAIAASIWSSRAWTFQERIFSRRCLLFCKEQMHYSCFQGVGYEDTQTGGLFRGKRHGDGLELSPGPMRDSINLINPFTVYAKAVQSYSGKALTMPGDVLSAFTGVMTWFSKTHDMSFLYGLPNPSLYRSLLWIAASPLVIRTGDANSSGKAAAHHTASSILPTWSWAGWIGSVHYEEDLFNIADIRSEIRLYNRFTREKEAADTMSPEIVDDLTAHNGVLRFWTASAKYCIMPAEDRYDFVGISRVESLPENTLRYAYITDQGGTRAGEVIIDTDIVKLPMEEAEFILICKARYCRRKIWKDGHGGRGEGVIVRRPGSPSAKRRRVLPREAKDWSYYKVMHITRSQGRAYRVAVGTVDETSWKLQNPVQSFVELS